MLGHEGIVLLVVNLVVASSGMCNPKCINGCFCTSSGSTRGRSRSRSRSLCFYCWGIGCRWSLYLEMNIHGSTLVSCISNRDPPQRCRFVMAPFTPTSWHESRLDAQHGGVPRRFSRQHMLCQICKKEGVVATAAWVSYCRFPSADLVLRGRAYFGWNSDEFAFVAGSLKIARRKGTKRTMNSKHGKTTYKSCSMQRPLGTQTLHCFLWNDLEMHEMQNCFWILFQNPDAETIRSATVRMGRPVKHDETWI